MCWSSEKHILIVIDICCKIVCPPGLHKHTFLGQLTLCLSYLMRLHPFIPTIATMDCCHCRLKSVITDNPCPVNEPTYGMSRGTDMSLFYIVHMEEISPFVIDGYLWYYSMLVNRKWAASTDATLRYSRGLVDAKEGCLIIQEGNVHSKTLQFVNVIAIGFLQICSPLYSLVKFFSWQCQSISFAFLNVVVFFCFLFLKVLVTSKQFGLQNRQKREVDKSDQLDNKRH